MSKKKANPWDRPEPKGLNEEVAVHVMGWIKGRPVMGESSWLEAVVDGVRIRSWTCPDYVNDLNESFTVLAKVQETSQLPFTLSNGPGGKHTFIAQLGLSVSGFGKTPGEAICQMALALWKRENEIA